MSEPIGRHAKQRAWYARPLVYSAAVVALLGAGGGAIAFAATRGPSPAQARAHAARLAEVRAAAEAAAVATQQAALLAGVTVTPADNATSVPLDATVSVSTTTGRLSAVKVTGPSGSPIPGALSATTGKWTSVGALDPHTTYTVTVAVTGQGVTATRTSKFTTLTPTALVTATVFPTAGLTVGVGQPIVLNFDHDITATAVRTAIEGRLVVAMSTPVPGGWYWFSPHELHFRPESYWPSHETVKVSGDLAGIDAGRGKWVAGLISDTFSIGDARISYANLQTERMTVTRDGQTLYSFPISGGRQQYPTMNGQHLVLDRASVVHMVSSTVGIPVNSPNGYDEYVYDDVHISDSGEYVHAAPWSVGSQGVTNVSHGCINVSPSNAKTFFDFSRVGDLVIVTGSSRPPAYGDHGVMDWDTPFSSWAPAHVVPLNPASATTSTSTSTTAAPRPPATPAAAPAPATATTTPSVATTARTTTTTSPTVSSSTTLKH